MISQFCFRIWTLLVDVMPGMELVVQAGETFGGLLGRADHQ